MTTKFSCGLMAASAAIVLMASVPATAQFVSQKPAAPAGPKLSAGVLKQLTAAQKAVTANDFATAMTDINAAKAVDNRTPYDDFKINQFAVYTQIQMKDFAGADVSAEAAADSPAMPDSEKSQTLQSAVVVAVNAKHYDKAAIYAKELLTITPPITSSAQLANMAQALELGNDSQDALTTAQKSIDATPPGKMPDHTALEVLLSAQVSLKDEPAAEKTLETLVADYNSPDEWGQMIDIAFGTKAIREIDSIWLGRLLYLTGAPVSNQDASMLGSTATHLTYFGDAQAALDHGGTDFANPAAKTAADKKTMATQIAAGQKANASYNAKIAEALYGYGMYPEAETAARLAISKGDTSEAPMVLGQALVAQGKYDDAITAFKQVTGGSDATPRITRLWIDYATTKKGPPPAAAAAAAPAPATPAK